MAEEVGGWWMEKGGGSNASRLLLTECSMHTAGVVRMRTRTDEEVN